jgi:hypothetical protein
MAITAAAGGLGAILGPVVMQASRNFTEAGSTAITTGLSAWSFRQNDTTMAALGAVPGALSGALLGSAAAAIHPAWLVPGAAIGAAVLGTVGVVHTHRLSVEYHKHETESASKRPAA